MGGTVAGEHNTEKIKVGYLRMALGNRVSDSLQERETQKDWY